MGKERYLSLSISKDLTEKVVLIGGARQVGKTTLALQFLSPSLKTNENYLSWDALKDRTKIRQFEFSNEKTVVFDEIHKFKNWRNLVKAFYDKLYPENTLLSRTRQSLIFISAEAIPC